jgi:hypothetical protein
MQFTTTILVSLLATSSFALPQTIVHPGAPVTLEISHYKTGCSPSGCTYNFDIASYGDQTPLGPFSTSCSGTDVQNADVACGDSQIQANLVPTGDGSFNLRVERLGKLNDETLLIAGNVTFPVVAEGQEQGAEMLAYSYGQLAQ